MTLNHMICPACGHDCYTSDKYVTCAACQTLYYASQSRMCDPNVAHGRTLADPLARSTDAIGTGRRG